MLELDQNNVQLQARLANKEEAIHAVGNLLVNSRYIKPGYVNSMLSREKVANTYLGNGIAIPHGLPKDRDQIMRTGIAVLQVPGGLQWNRGETVYLVVGIAARSDEHIGILANLTNILNDEATIRKLTTTGDANDIILSLTRPGERVSAPVEVPADLPVYVDLTITNPTGLHARPATVFASLAKEFASEVRVRNGDRVANGKSLASLLQLGVESGSVIRVMAKEPDECSRASRAKVQQAIGKDGVLLVDARSAEMYRGEFHPATQCGGHIPGAINLAAQREVDADGSFKAWKVPTVRQDGTFKDSQRTASNIRGSGYHSR